MRQEIEWLNDALSSKKLLTHEMSLYCVMNGEIKAHDGRVTAGHPWPHGGEFLVPGVEVEKLLRRLPEEITFKQTDKGIVISSGKFRGLIKTQPADKWPFAGIENANWQPIPQELPELMIKIRPFVSDNAIQRWALAIALEDEWLYATNNVAIASARCPALKDIHAMLPCWAVDFVASRLDGLTSWCWTDHFVGFAWDSGAWMRSQLIDMQFPEKAAEMARAAHDENPTQIIDDDFKKAFSCVSDLAADTIKLYANRIEASFGAARVIEITDCEIPPDSTHSIWGAQFLAPVIAAATHWQPSLWPQPSPWKGETLAGYVVGRTR